MAKSPHSNDSHVHAMIDDTSARRDWLAVLARISTADLERSWGALEVKPSYVAARNPQIGMMMGEARAGGTGGRFNLGHISVSRAVMRLDSGEVGVGYCLGHNERKAALIALFDALLQTSRHDEILQTLIEPQRREQQADRETRSRKAASSKVDFFTMVRGDNPDGNLRK